MNTLLFGDRANPVDGLGRLAQTLADNVDGLQPVSALSEITAEAGALVHTRRDPNLMPALIEHCQRVGTPLLNLATGSSVELPESLNFLYLECPNISLEVLGFMERVQQACAQMDTRFNLNITEHHQKAKADTSGTACAMHNQAAALKWCANPVEVYEDHIVSVRDLNKTRASGFAVPPEHEAGYAIHEVQLRDVQSEEVLRHFKSLEIYGRKTYADGLSEVLKTLRGLEPITGRVHISDFVREQALVN